MSHCVGLLSQLPRAHIADAAHVFSLEVLLQENLTLRSYCFETAHSYETDRS